MASEQIFVNINSTSLASARAVSATNNQEEAWKKFVIADNKELEIFFVDGSGNYVDTSAYSSRRVGVGGINKRPTGGSFVFTHGGNDSIVAFDESASALELLLDAAPYSFDCAVTAPASGIWIVKFNNVGAESLPTTDASALTPDSAVSVDRLVTGDGSTKEEWIIRLYQEPWAYSESWSDIVSPGKGISGSLNFGTENLYKAMASANSLSGYFEVELTDSSANISTVIQAPVKIIGEVLGSGASGSGAFELAIPKETIFVTINGEDENCAIGSSKIVWRMPYAMTVTELMASVKHPPTGSSIIVDVNEGGSSILSTKLSIDNLAESSVGSSAPYVISDSALAMNSEMSIDVDQVGSGGGSDSGQGLKVYITGTRA